LDEIIVGNTVSTLRPVTSSSASVPFTFTGQGAFYSGLGSSLYEAFQVYRSAIDELDHLVQCLGFPSVISAMDGALLDKKAAPPVLTQLALIVSQIALVRFWGHLGVTPSVVIGHSLGEYAALVAVDVLSAADAIFLVGKRAQLLQDSCEMGSHAMLAVRISVEVIEKIVPTDMVYEISCMNARESTVMGGSQSHTQAI
jgi:asperthecin polyketide synthase